MADFIFSVSSTIEDKQKNLGKIFVAKNRNGPDGIVYPIQMDTSNVNIRILPKTTMPTGVVPLNPVTLSPSMQSELLKQKYRRTPTTSILKFRISKGNMVVGGVSTSKDIIAWYKIGPPI